MPISITWGTRVINIPKNYLTLISGTLYELDTEQFRLDLKALEDDEEGQPFPDTHRHATEVTVAGITFARIIEIINNYSITFEDGQYSVRLVGSNNNFFDVENGILNQNQVQVIPGNSAGLIVHESGVSGLTPEESTQLMATALEDGGRLQDIDTRLPSDPADQSLVEAAIASAIAGLPSLAEIEASDVLAKQAELIRSLGMNQENFRVKSQTYDSQGNLIGATIRIYSSSGDAQSDTNPLAEYQMTASFSSLNQCTSYLVKKVA